MHVDSVGTHSDDTKENPCETVSKNTWKTELVQQGYTIDPEKEPDKALQCFNKIVANGVADSTIYAKMAFVYFNKFNDWAQCEFYGFVRMTAFECCL